jgi:hypothetical protein
MLTKIGVQIVAICFVIYLAIQTFDFIKIESFPFLFACAYTITIALEIYEGKMISWIV